MEWLSKTVDGNLLHASGTRSPLRTASFALAQKGLSFKQGYDEIWWDMQHTKLYASEIVPIARNIQWKSGSFETMKTDVGQKKPAT